MAGKSVMGWDGMGCDCDYRGGAPVSDVNNRHHPIAANHSQSQHQPRAWPLSPESGCNSAAARCKHPISSSGQQHSQATAVQDCARQRARLATTPPELPRDNSRSGLLGVCAPSSSSSLSSFLARDWVLGDGIRSSQPNLRITAPSPSMGVPCLICSHLAPATARASFSPAHILEFLLLAHVLPSIFLQLTPTRPPESCPEHNFIVPTSLCPARLGEYCTDSF